MWRGGGDEAVEHDAEKGVCKIKLKMRARRVGLTCGGRNALVDQPLLDVHRVTRGQAHRPPVGGKTRDKNEMN